jgi:peptidoglycan/LPS O-acetylase OafA/YrhL
MENRNLQVAMLPRGSRPHLPGFDGLRGLAILAVMCHHLMRPDYPAGVPGGVAGVVIKGFLITGILLEAKGSAHYFSSFFARRALRIFPLYYGVLALLFFVLPWLGANPATSAWTHRHAGDLLAIGQTDYALQKWLWLYGANIQMAVAAHGWIYGSLSHFWSLAVEEHFYLLWPVLVLCCSTRSLARVCLGLAAASLLCRVAFLAGGLAPEYIFVLSPCRFDGLALGGFVAALARLWSSEGAPDPVQPIFAKPGVWVSIRLLFAIQPPANGSNALLRAAFTRLFRLLLPLTALVLLACYRFNWLVITIGHSVLAATFATALPGAALAQRSSPLLRGGWLCLAPLQTLGKYSYGLYVIHPLIFQPIEELLATPGIQNMIGGSYALTGILRLVLCLPISLLLAWAVWHGFEKHFLRLKRFFPTGIRAPLAEAKIGPGLPAVHPTAE